MLHVGGAVEMTVLRPHIVFAAGLLVVINIHNVLC